VSKIASHGPAEIEGGSMISRDGPAQVDDRGRRRDGGESFAVALKCRKVIWRDGEGERRETRILPWRTEPADFRLSHLADALGTLKYPSETFTGVAIARRRFSLR
jgi:hypothetical protein